MVTIPKIVLEWYVFETVEEPYMFLLHGTLARKTTLFRAALKLTIFPLCNEM